jgi:hypothetical protein
LHCWQKRTAGKHGQDRFEYFEASFHVLNFPFLIVLAFADFRWPAAAFAKATPGRTHFPAIHVECSLCLALSKEPDPNALLPKTQMRCQEEKSKKNALKPLLPRTPGFVSFVCFC